jgi:hypothetical protein
VSDPCALLQHLQNTVEHETGYALETENDFIGEFAPPATTGPVTEPKHPDLVTTVDRARHLQDDRRGHKNA